MTEIWNFGVYFGIACQMNIEIWNSSRFWMSNNMFQKMTKNGMIRLNPLKQLHNLKI